MKKLVQLKQRIGPDYESVEYQLSFSRYLILAS